MLENEIKDYKFLAETFTLTAFFRSLTYYYASEYIIKFLLKTSNLSLDDLKKRWDGFDKVFWDEKWNTISALSFSTIIEARWELIDSILEEKIKNNDTVILELWAWFSPRWLYFLNKIWYKNYIETDLSKTISLKNKFYSFLETQGFKIPKVMKFNVEQKSDWKEMYDYIKILKLENPNIVNLQIVSEWLLIYLNKKQQKHFFEDLNIFAWLLNNEWIKTNYLTIDMPTHENFTNWLTYEWFDFTTHIEVMKNVDPEILESLHNTQKDFLMENSIKKIKKYYYDMNIINSLHTPKLEKYRNLPELEQKIVKFLTQKILFAWEVIF